jgi:hypothetical protein
MFVLKVNSLSSASLSFDGANFGVILGSSPGVGRKLGWETDFQSLILRRLLVRQS